MIRLRGKTSIREVRSALRRTKLSGRKVAAQELNRQRTQSRTRIARQLRQATGVTPLRRWRNRILLPRAGLARPDRLSAFGIALVHVVPARWFLRGRGKRAQLALPNAVRLLEGAPAVGQPFVAEGRERVSVFRRGADRRNSTGAQTWLPIKEQNVDTGSIGDAAIARVIAELAREFPARWQDRMRREIARIWGA